MPDLAPFLPARLLRSLRHSRKELALPRVERFDAALLFSDISGFTALTERLQERGRDGAEEIALVVEAAFAPAIDAITRWGGSIVSFGGDALFALFDGATPVRRAIATAETIREAFAARPEVATSAGPAVLGISQAIHHGHVQAWHLGDGRRRHYVAGGSTVRALAALEGRAARGRIEISRAARAQARGERVPRPRPSASTAAGLPNGAGLYLPRGLREILDGFEGSYRRAAVLFLETADPTRRPERALQRFVTALDTALGASDGRLLKNDLSPAGTKWLCTFGIPSAHEDDVARALHAALSVRHAVDGEVKLRGGLHVGTLVNIVVGSGPRRSFDVMGDVVNTAARALGKAAWGEILVTDAVRKADPRLHAEPRGAHAVKGKAEPLALHAAQHLRAAAAMERLQIPLQGRAQEIAALSSALEDARKGRGAILALLGDAGMGKSRLAALAQAMARAMGIASSIGRAGLLGTGAYAALQELLRTALDLPEGADGLHVRRRIADVGKGLELGDTDQRHLAEVLGAREDGSPLRHLDPGAIRLNNALAVRALFAARARRAPQLVVLEDMHAADELTRDVVKRIGPELAAAAVVLLVTFRPGYEPPGDARTLALSELSPDAIRLMVASLVDVVADDVPDAVQHLIVERTQGNPYYVEETVRHLRETGLLAQGSGGKLALLRDPDSLDLPDSLESAVASRLDRLPAESRRLLQAASVLGRTFEVAVIEGMAGTSAPVHPVLAGLEAQGLLAREGSDEGEAVRYAFASALVRDVAYASVLKQRRRQLHEAAAQAMESIDPEAPGRLASLGHHWDQAGDPSRARPYYMRAARGAVAIYAVHEAERLYRAYLALVDHPSLEAVRARYGYAEDVLMFLGRIGDAAQEFLHCEQDARTIGDDEGVFLGMQGAASTLMHSGKVPEARAAYERALAFAQEIGNRHTEWVALAALATIARATGQVDEALSRQEESLVISRSLCDRKKEGAILGNLANLLQDQGRSAEALALYEQALVIHREVGNRHHEAIILGSLGLHLQSDGRLSEARKRFEQALTILLEIGDRRFAGAFQGSLGIVEAEEGNVEAARPLIESALSLVREVGDRRTEGYLLMGRARMERRAGEIVHAEETLAAAESLLARVGDKLLLAMTLCERIHIILAGGQAHRALKRATALAEQLRARPESSLAKAIAQAARALAAHEAGEALPLGELTADLPPRLRPRLPEPG